MPRLKWGNEAEAKYIAAIMRKARSIRPIMAISGNASKNEASSSSAVAHVGNSKLSTRTLLKAQILGDLLS